jgi:hypothetical protein
MPEIVNVQAFGTDDLVVTLDTVKEDVTHVRRDLGPANRTEAAGLLG